LEPATKHRAGYPRTCLVALVGLTTLGLLIMGVTCARQPATARLYALGQTVDVDGWRITVHGLSALPAEAGRAPRPGQVFCTVEVTVENVSDRIRFVMPEKQMQLADASQVYVLDHDASVLAARTRQLLPPEGEVGVGAQVHGAASYQIPRTAQGLRWVFRSGLLPWSPAVEFTLGALQAEP